MKTIADVETFLRNIRERSLDDSNVARETLVNLKKDAAAQGDEATAKLIWCHETILSVQENYLGAFE
jgi:hypothetical protein